ncbi:NADPH-dependent FMN reductase [Massilia sp. TSP1-1-2]|uniref:NADPH-dependent FMN reductase n=1 Tax=unclassified Massilia TaxID=2609279 RepID=UPI003CEF1960
MSLHVIALSGSLRAASVNTALLRAAAALAPPGLVVTLYEEMGALPHFNPDHETPAPAAVARWQTLLRECDAILIACPEYAHGVPGTLKNALDWVVGTTGLEGKSVALLNSSPRASHAQAALAEIVATMGWSVLEAASVRIACARKEFDPATLMDMPEFTEPLRAALLILAEAAQHHVASRFPPS